MKKVMCTGTFDILHPGHLNYFEQARTHGDYLIIVVATDENAKKQGKDPIHNQEQRQKQVTEYADKALIGQQDKLKVVEEEKPDTICLGYDQKIDENKLKDELTKRGLHPKIIRLKAYYPEKYKSSIMRKERIKQLQSSHEPYP